ncbi:FtsX-like permease family protein [Parabacteroides sp. PF5-6]|uniref:ABC transporter permease n=1 Tax=Parabacteroides sp. PF5-6 TaxID=1742403 RepID=UPI002404D83F|nr:FtsX-like permease family protein [Parabacteroides sp. PF5-6]MDF9829150.1 putative ABC transport system permease protein [Parabacteroides sp. PF5-6]
MKNISLKLIFRSWWRNKTFAVISILSLAVGIACTNLLVAFVIHEYHVEAGNPNRERIYCLVQDSPFQEGDKVFYASDHIPGMIKERYPEVEEYLCLNNTNVSHVTVGETMYDPINLMLADASLPRFFPYETLTGSLEEALNSPGKIALSEATARRFFGKEDPLGQSVCIYHSPERGTMYQVAAVIKEREQSILTFDAITAMKPEYGGTSFLLMNQAIDAEAFALRLKEDKIPTFMVDKGRYYLYSLQENHFKEYKAQSIFYLRKQNKLTLDIGLFSALLILLIACFNYINLNFSRLLQQVKMIHVQQLMGATRFEIHKQLFLDIFLTVCIGFLLSLLIMYDLIPVLNSVLSGQMKASFIFSGQVMPLLIGLILVLSLIPALYVGRKLAVVSRQRTADLTGGKKKQGIISILTVMQFVISITLVIATLTVNSQLGLIRQGGAGYRGLIEIELPQGNESRAKPFVSALRSQPELGEINTTMLSLFHYGIRQIVIPDEQGNETYLGLAEYGGDTGFLSNFKIELLQGMQPKEALERYPRPVYINQRFADVLVGKDENPIGKPLKAYDKEYTYRQKEEDGSKENPMTTIVGVVKDFFNGSLEQEIPPAIIHIENEANRLDSYVYFRLDKNQPERLAQVKQIWEKQNPGQLFVYRNVYEDFLLLNQKTFGLADLLLMYSLISLFLTCFGLYGIALYAAEQRTKEIGIRKVNGATIRQILQLLNKRFLFWIGIAFLIAAPLSWLLLDRWLQGFVYRVALSAGVFVVALLAVTGIALLTVSWHSYRAAAGNPVKALRDE